MGRFLDQEDEFVWRGGGGRDEMVADRSGVCGMSRATTFLGLFDHFCARSTGENLCKIGK